VITGDDTCFRQIEFVGILKGTKNRDLAEKWIDFMLSTKFQEDMPLKMYIFPVNPSARLDELFVKFLMIPKKPAYVSPEAISTNRDKWLSDWAALVLH
jgi:thiamine transport system substrate-binding protein